MDVVVEQNKANIILTGPTFTGMPGTTISWQAAATGLSYCTSGLREEGLASFTPTQFNPDFISTQYNITLYNRATSRLLAPGRTHGCHLDSDEWSILPLVPLITWSLLPWRAPPFPSRPDAHPSPASPLLGQFLYHVDQAKILFLLLPNKIALKLVQTAPVSRAIEMFKLFQSSPLEATIKSKSRSANNQTDEHSSSSPVWLLTASGSSILLSSRLRPG